MSSFLNWYTRRNACRIVMGTNITVIYMNFLSVQLFKEQGVRVVVVDVVTWTIEDPILISTNSHEYLDSFKDYSPNLPQNYDSAMLFT